MRRSDPSSFSPGVRVPSLVLLRRITVCTLLALFALSGLASEEVNDGPSILASVEDHAYYGEGNDPLRGSFFNPSPLVVGTRLNVYFSGGIWCDDADSECEPAWTTCEYGDETIRSYTDDIDDDLTYGARVSPCCGDEAENETHYGLGNVVESPWDSGTYFMFMDRTESGGEFKHGDFREVLLGISTDSGVTWTFPGHTTPEQKHGYCNYSSPNGDANPLVRKDSASGGDDDVQIFEVNMVQGTDGNDDILFGIMRYGKKGENGQHVPAKMGRMRIIEDGTKDEDILVQIRSNSNPSTPAGRCDQWTDVDTNGDHGLDEDDFCELSWPSVTPTGIYDSGSGYELWGAKTDTSATAGCDDPYDSGRKWVYRTFSETTFGSTDQAVTSDVADFPMPNESYYANVFPVRFDYDSKELVIFSTSDRMCWMYGQGDDPKWPGYTPFRGMELAVVTLGTDTLSPNDCNPSGKQACLRDDLAGFQLQVDGESSYGYVKPWGPDSFCWTSNGGDGDRLIACLTYRKEADDYWTSYWSSAQSSDYTVYYFKYTGTGTVSAFTYTGYSAFEGDTKDHDYDP